MILNKEELKILNVFRQLPNTELSIQDISRFSKKSSKTYIFNTLKKLEQSGFIRKRRLGNINIYKALFSPQTLASFSILDLEDFENSKIPEKPINRILEHMKPAGIPFCLLVFGSFAEGKPTKNSDLDVAIIVHKERNRAEAVMNRVELYELTKVDWHVITRDEFLKMLLIGEANLGKEIVQKHVLIYGNEIYYQVIEEAFRSGFDS